MKHMIHITLKGGAVKEFEAPVTPMQIAKSIGEGLYKAVCVAKIDGVVRDLRTPIEKDAQVELLTFDDEEGKRAFWHTASHVMAQAVLHLFPLFDETSKILGLFFPGNHEGNGLQFDYTYSQIKKLELSPEESDFLAGSVFEVWGNK